MRMHKHIRKFLFFFIVIWTGIVGGSYFWNVSHEKEYMAALAKKEALADFNKNMAFRTWAVLHGGVYVKADKRTPPNPNLSHVPERDVITPSGKMLTLMNSAYMLRQLMNEFPKEYGVNERIVSDRPLWSPNAADPWEADAIKKFKQGSKEKFEFATYQGEPYLRFMRPIFITKECLKCHGNQGYQVGDVRGGVSVMVKMVPYLEAFKRNQLRLLATHALIYTAGLLLIFFGGKSFSSYLIRLEEEQAKVQESHIELELKVQERTRELSQANEQLKELDKLKSMFVASMSHELRTPLNSILGFTGILLQGISGPLNEKQVDQLQRVNAAGKHLLSLISDVIDISKLEAGCAEVNVEEFSLRTLIEDTKKEIEIFALSKGLNIEIEMDQDIQMQSDKRRVYQCLLNYLSNAVKFTENSSTIVIKAEESGGDVKISVTDQGIGIAQEEQSKLFEPFQRLETSQLSNAGGTGLGLYITRKITENLLQGKIWMNSVEGIGSTFGLKLPKNITREEH